MKKYGLPWSVDLQLTEMCNLRCKMCYFWGETGAYVRSQGKGKPKTLEFEIIKRLVEYLVRQKPFYSFFGGEPLMYPYLEEVIRIIKKNGSAIDTPTNGILLEEHAAMLVETGFDSVRVSIDGPREINDSQRGKGSYDKAMAGIEALYREKEKNGAILPSIGILYTVTPSNFQYLEQFLLNELNLSAVSTVTIQVENYLTEDMGLAYAKLLKEKFNITSEINWRGLVRNIEDFSQIDPTVIVRQVEMIKNHYKELRKNLIFLPPTYTSENLAAYFTANWNEMTDKYRGCPVPWAACDITATGDVAPCHVFYDLTMGNLHEKSFEEIWNGENYKIFREHMNECKLMSICPGCCILYIVGQRLRKRE